MLFPLMTIFLRGTWFVAEDSILSEEFCHEAVPNEITDED
ncbi:hypothetical protein SAMN06265346_102223 [Flavobacterium hercynium]|nr:hypothetical protein SAMN06265346_102223 [Flavobacterium hercynium]